MQVLDSKVQSQADRRASAYANDIMQIRAKLEEAGHWPITKQSVQQLTTFERLVLRDWYAVRLLAFGNSFYQCQEGYLDEETCKARNLYPDFIRELNAIDYDFRNMRASFIAEVRRVSQ